MMQVTYQNSFVVYIYTYFIILEAGRKFLKTCVHVCLIYILNQRLFVIVMVNNHFFLQGRAYMVEDKDWQFQCCGVVSQLNYNLNGAGPLVVQVWRQKDATDYELISSQTVTVGKEII